MKRQPNIKHFFRAPAKRQDVAEPLPLGAAPLVPLVPDQPADHSDESDDEMMERASVSAAENISHDVVEPGGDKDMHSVEEAEHISDNTCYVSQAGPPQKKSRPPKRGFSRKWLDEFSWLGYDINKCTMFCKPCRRNGKIGPWGGNGTNNFR